MSDSTETTAVPTWYKGYLWLPRFEASDTFEAFLSRWTVQGYLVIGVAEDVARHGDMQFLQTRRAHKPWPDAALYWQRHALLHQQLCSQGLQHMPVALGPGPGEPFALAWLLPVPARGKLYAAAGFEQTVELTLEQRDSWLDWMARQLGSTSTGQTQRVLLQPPGGARPACWNYGSYRGDVPIDGSHTGQLRTLLAALPRYACDITTPALAPTPEAAAEWPLLLNQRPGGSIEGMRREQVHRELFPGSQPEGEVYWLSTSPAETNKLVFTPEPKIVG